MTFNIYVINSRDIFASYNFLSVYLTFNNIFYLLIYYFYYLSINNALGIFHCISYFEKKMIKFDL